MFYHSQLLRENRYQEALRGKLEPDYLAVMPGKTKLPDTMKLAVADLERGLRILKAEKTGIGADQDSISAKMTLVLQAMNSCAKKTDLNIDKIIITGPNITLSGTTPSQAKAGEVFEAMRKQGLEVGKQSVGDDGTFSVTLVVKKQSQRP